MTQFFYTVTAPVGLHARPAGMLVELVKGLSSSVTLSKGERSAPADRLMSLLLMEICQGDQIAVTLEGPNEQADMQTLKAFLRSYL